MRPFTSLHPEAQLEGGGLISPGGDEMHTKSGTPTGFTHTVWVAFFFITLCHFLAVHLWASDSTFLSLSFLVCQIGLMAVSALWSHGGLWGLNTHKALRVVLGTGEPLVHLCITLWPQDPCHSMPRCRVPRAGHTCVLVCVLKWETQAPPTAELVCPPRQCVTNSYVPSGCQALLEATLPTISHLDFTTAVPVSQ